MGKQSKATAAEERRKYLQQQKQQQAERQKQEAKKTRRIISISVSAIALIVALAIVLPIVLRRKAPTMDELDFSAVDIASCTDTEEVTEYVRMNISYTNKDGEKKTENIVIRLFEDVAPKTVENFQMLVKQDFYSGLTFHRIMEGFMIQGGDPDGNGQGGSPDTVKGEFTENGWENNLSHVRGVISMARTNDPNSASSQFFIVHEDSSASLDQKYASFGYVVYGMSTVDAIATTEVDKKDPDSPSPIHPVTINEATFVKVAA